MSAGRAQQFMKERTAKLDSEFSECLAEFERRAPFQGHRLDCHLRTLQLLRAHATAAEALDDDTFLRSLYATLKAWGVNRGGRMMPFEDFKQGLESQSERIRDIQSLVITQLGISEADAVARTVGEIMKRLSVTRSSSGIVGNSKALHHLLPSLIPPIDRKYTLQFFYGYNAFQKDDAVVFGELYPHFHRIGTSHAQTITERMTADICNGGRKMHTSETKVIDNAIVGFALKHLQ